MIYHIYDYINILVSPTRTTIRPIPYYNTPYSILQYAPILRQSPGVNPTSSSAAQPTSAPAHHYDPANNAAGPKPLRCPPKSGGRNALCRTTSIVVDPPDEDLADNPCWPPAGSCTISPPEGDCYYVPMDRAVLRTQRSLSGDAISSSMVSLVTHLSGGTLLM